MDSEKGWVNTVVIFVEGEILRKHREPHTNSEWNKYNTETAGKTIAFRLNNFTTRFPPPDPANTRPITQRLQQVAIIFESQAP